MKFTQLFAPVLTLALLFSAGTTLAQSIRVDQGFARATMGKQMHGAAYVQIENQGKTDDALVSASSPAAAKVELHTMSMEGDVMKMRALDQLEIKAGQKIEMKPGAGHHLMLMGLKNPLKAGDSFPLTLNFRKAGKVETQITVQEGAMSGKPASGADMHDHEHHHDH